MTERADVPPPVHEPATDADRAVVAAQLGRVPRGTRAIAHRCPCGLPDVVETTPRLADGTPFPTLFYLTCPRAVAACSRLESAGVMKEMSARLADRSGPGRRVPGRARGLSRPAYARSSRCRRSTGRRPAACRAG